VPSLTESRLSAQGRYAERVAVAGEDTFAADYPFPFELAPAALAWRR